MDRAPHAIQKSQEFFIALNQGKGKAFKSMAMLNKTKYKGTHVLHNKNKAYSQSI